MLVKMRNLTLCVTAALLLAVSLSTCDSSFGFGEPIDWEPPVLELWKPSRDPSYVRENAELTGSVTDNIAVGRVELRYAKEPRQLLSTATLSGSKTTSKTWTITPDFYDWAQRLGIENIDGEKIPIEIVAYDTRGNAGEPRAISLIIDLTEPRVEDVWITRSAQRIAYLDPLGYSEDPAEGTLKRLETTDPDGEISANADRYQNGWFWIDARLAEDETKIDNVKLQIYDARYPDTPLLEDDGDEAVESLFEGKNRDAGYSVTAPRWTIKEEDLLARGAALFNQAHGIDYVGDYKNGQRYYYQVVIVAHDKSENKSPWRLEDQDFFVMWETSDVPKGILDPMIGTQVTKGDTLPVEFFDDDSLIRAYTDLLTIDQWKGYTEGSSYNDPNPATRVYLDAAKTLRMPDGSDDAKLAWLWEQLEAGKPVLNWKNDRSGYAEGDPITELLNGSSPNNITPFIATGTKDEDYGSFVLFTLAKDKKLEPHPEDMDRWAGRMWNITVVDDNQPMIIFDTEDTGGQYGSPEENTFPRLKDGRYFTIKGYTLRQGDSSSPNKVDTLRMAWIPLGESASAQAALLPNTLAALKKGTDYPAGVQYWSLTLTDAAGRLESDPAYVADYEDIGSPAISYRKQYFSKTFDILGADFDSAEGQQRKNFHLDGVRENETKLFVFVAIDNMSHDVSKQLPILGRKTPPKLTVWDISDREIPSGTTLSPPSIYDYVTGAIDGPARAAYQAALATYNALPVTYTALKTIYGTGAGAEEANPLQVYPRGKMLRYWVQAEEEGDLAIQSILLEDITYSSANPINIGYYDQTDSRLSYVETLPENQQKVFRFTATNTLGIPAVIQRTVTITSTSMVIDISTLKPNGTYGISANTNNNVPEDQEDRIAILARFSNMVEWEGTNPPLLNVRYQNPSGTYRVQQVPTITPRSPGSLSLEFRFSVPAGAAGELETMYDHTAMTTGYTFVGTQVGEINRPITLPEGTRILDVSGEGGGIPAFIPGYTSGSTRTETWKTDTGSLQAKKDIMLDGVRPNLVVVSNGAYLPVSGKTPATASLYYFKSNETISFTLKTDKRVQPSGAGTPRIRFYLGDANTGGNQRGPYYATYQRSPSTTEMLFTFPVSATVSSPYADSNNYAVRDGVIITSGTGNNAQYNVNINTANGGIEDIVGNAVSQLVNAQGVVQTNSPVPTPVFPTGTTVYIDQGRPAAPQTFLRNTSNVNQTNFTGEDTEQGNYNINLNMHFADYTPPNTEPWNTGYTKWYSKNGGLEWTEYTGTAGILLENDTHNLVTRYIDRAGNEGLTSTKTVTINAEFPKLLGVTVAEGDGTYNRGKSLRINLDFADTVSRVTTGADTTLSITLADTTTTTNNPDGTNPSYQIALNRTDAAVAANGKTLTFTWTNVNGKDMLNGLRVTAMNLSALRDTFGNAGPATINAATTGTVTVNAQTGVPAAYNVAYNLTGIIVSGIAPAVRTYSPVNAEGRTGNVTTSVSDDNKTITLTFSKPVQRGQGAITVRPHGNYAIPAVMENDGYYLTVTYPTTTTQAEAISSSAGTNSTYVQGMYDIYNAMTTQADKNYLITGGTLAAPTLSNYTGLSAGPYKKMTHGLTEGAGYTGNYNNTTPGVNSPAPTGSDYMVPDTTTKWVLDYQYEIYATTGAVANIRGALTRMGFRRQDIAVTSTSVVIAGSTVTITLNEPLLPGLQWDLIYDAGTFTDTAGNQAAAITDGAYWFWSKGIQKPVVRVNRKSSDARSTVPIYNTSNPYPGNPGNTAGQTYNVSGYNVGGTGNTTAIDTFNTIGFRIETETPKARIYYGALRGSSWTSGGLGSATTAFTGRATLTTGTNLTTTATITWAGAKNDNQTTGSWIRNNMIFRNSNSGSNDDNNYPHDNASYTITENGVSNTHYVRGGDYYTRNQQGNYTTTATGTNYRYYGFRSFNRDAQRTDLTGLALSNNTDANNFATYLSSSAIGSGTYGDLEASKSYIVAEARVDHSNANYTTPTHTSIRGWEGAFRTVIAMQRTNGTYSYLLCGTNVKSGIPTIAGFPTKDGVHNQDTRYLKVFSNGTVNTRTNTYYWVSTEIVTPWYVQPYYADGSYANAGDSYDWMTAGYGDVSYGYNVRHHGNNQPD